jgi:hypothetical protein
VIEGKAQFNLSLPAGTYDLKYTAPTGEATQKVLVTDKQEYLAPLVVPNSKTFSQLKINNHDRTVLDLGFLQLNWFWAYVIFSIIFSISIHRIMKLS